MEIEDNKIIRYCVELFKFDDSMYYVDSELTDRINSWSDYLNMEESEYRIERQKQLSAYLSSRKKKRDLTWYFERMNFESIKMILSIKRNQKMYDSIITDYIKK